MKRNRRLMVLVVAVLTAGLSAAAVAKPSQNAKGEPFDVALIGDLPYNALQEVQTARLFE